MQIELTKEEIRIIVGDQEAMLEGVHIPARAGVQDCEDLPVCPVNHVDMDPESILSTQKLHKKLSRYLEELHGNHS